MPDTHINHVAVKLLVAVYIRLGELRPGASTYKGTSFANAVIDQMEKEQKGKNKEKKVFLTPEQLSPSTNGKRHGQVTLEQTISRLRQKEEHSFCVASNEWTEKLLRFCGCNALNEIELFLTSRKVTKDTCLKVIENLKLPNIFAAGELVLPPYILSETKVENLEFETPGIQVSCITHNIKWASFYIPQYAKKIITNNNIYRYILTEDQYLENLETLRETIADHPSLKKLVQVRRLYSHDLYKRETGLANIGGITIPIANDIVLYQKLSTTTKYTFRQGLIGTRMDVTENPDNLMIEIERGRAEKLLAWFNRTWSEIKDFEEKW